MTKPALAPREAAPSARYVWMLPPADDRQWLAPERTMKTRHTEVTAARAASVRSDGAPVPSNGARSSRAAAARASARLLQADCAWYGESVGQPLCRAEAAPIRRLSRPVTPASEKTTKAAKSRKYSMWPRNTPAKHMAMRSRSTLFTIISSSGVFVSTRLGGGDFMCCELLLSVWTNAAARAWRALPPEPSDMVDDDRAVMRSRRRSVDPDDDVRSAAGWRIVSGVWRHTLASGAVRFVARTLPYRARRGFGRFRPR
mmetsp:Transcript_22922/g.68813  ORF Transcript_22922/g.68813 Transcript_22922/m.68813 type:complete len:257 (-) Transcript_22922:203-973(-)